MATTIKHKNNLIRINPSKKNELEYSSNDGKVWYNLYKSDSNIGEFKDLLIYKNEILAVTNIGICYSTQDAKVWYTRYKKNSNTGSFHDIILGNGELLANTEKGLFYSNQDAKVWYKK